MTSHTVKEHCWYRATEDEFIPCWYRATEDEWDLGRVIVFKCLGQLTEDEETFATGLTEDGRSVKLRLIYWEFKELTDLEVALL